MALANEDDNLPPEREVKDFRFKQLSKIRVSSTPGSLPLAKTQLVAVANTYGLVFVGSEAGFKVLRSGDITEASVGKHVNQVVEGFDFWANVVIGATPTHLCISADNLTLAVAVAVNNVPFVFMYDVRAFANKGAQPHPFTASPLHAAPGFSVNNIVWNPGAPGLMAVCLSDGSLSLWMLAEQLARIAQLGGENNFTAICWSPKGKQLVAGKLDGTLTQYDQKLEQKAHIPCPQLFEAPFLISDILWASTNVFITSYVPVENDPTIQPTVIVTVSSKTEPPKYTTYEDICYGSDEERNAGYLFTQIAEWEMVLGASYKGQEVGILGRGLENKTLWEIWSLEDSGRAELPLTLEQDNTYPMGFGVDFTPQNEILLGENKTHPPSPIFYVLSTDGVLCPFYMMYSGKPNITRPPQPLAQTGERKVSQSLQIPKAQVAPQAPQPTPAVVQPKEPQPLSFGGGAPSQPAQAQKAFSFAKPASTDSGFAFGTATSKPSFSFGQSPGDAIQKPASTFSFGASPPAATSPPAEPPKSAGFSFGSSAPTPASTQAIFGAGSQSAQASFSAISSKGAGTPTLSNLLVGAQSKLQEAQQAGAAKPAPGMTVPLSLSGPLTMQQKPHVGASTVQPKPVVATTSFPASVRPVQTTNTFTSQALSQPAGSGFPFAPPKSQASEKPVVQKPAAPASTASIPPQQLPVASRPLATPQKSQNRAIATAQKEPSTHRPTVSAQSHTAGRPVPIQAQPGTGVKPTPTLQQSVASAKQAGSSNPFIQSILDETSHFQKELDELKQRTGLRVVNIGTGDEMLHIKMQINEMKGFCKEIKENAQCFNKEVNTLKSECLELFAQVEDCKMKNQRNNQPEYLQLLKSRSLDPASTRTMHEIHQLYHYLDNGIRDVNSILDTEWEKFQSQRKGARRRLQSPASDAIYRTLSCNTNIISEQQRRLEQITSHLQGMKLFNTTSNWQTETPGNSKKEEVISSPVTAYMESIMSTSKPSPPQVSPVKQAKLREILGRRKVTPVKSTAPANLSMSKIISAESLHRMLSNSQSSLEAYDESGDEEDETEDSTADSTLNTMDSQGKGFQPRIIMQSTPNRPQAKASDAMKPVKPTVGLAGKGTITYGSPPKITDPKPQPVVKVAYPGLDLKHDMTSPIKLDTSKPAAPANVSVGKQISSSVVPQAPDHMSAKDKFLLGQFKSFANIPTSAQSGSSVTLDKPVAVHAKSAESMKPVAPASSRNLPEVEDITPPTTPPVEGQPPGQKLPVVQPPAVKSLFNAPSSKTAFVATKPDAKTSFSGGVAPLGPGSPVSGPGADAGVQAVPTMSSLGLGSKAGFSFGGGKHAAAMPSSTPASGFSFGAAAATSGSSERKPAKSVSPVSADATSTTPDSSAAGFRFGSAASASGFSFTKAAAESTTPVSQPTSAAAPTSAGYTFGSKTTVTSSATASLASVTTTASSGFAALAASSAAPISVPASSAAKSLFSFGGANASSAQSSLGFGAKPAATQASGDAVSETSPSTTAATTSLFGGSGFAFGKSSQPSSSMTGLFGQPSSLGSSAFSQATSTVAPATVTTTTAVTSGPTTPDATESPGVPASSTATTTSATTTTTAASLFTATTSATASGSTGSIFGQALATSTKSSPFGQAPTSTTTSSTAGQAKTTSIFGQAAFGQASSATGLFGQTPSSAASGSEQSATSATARSLFGQTPASTAASVATTPATTPNLFGQTPASTAVSSSTSLFGQTAASSGTSPNLFGQTPASAAASPTASGLFGQTSASTATSVFGQSATPTAASTLFGQSAASTAASGTNSATTQSLFGQTPASTATSGFGQTTTTSASGFGGGSSGAFGQAPAFGHPPTSGSGTFGSSAPVFGQTSSAGFGSAGFGKPVFEQSATSTSQSTAPSAFGQSKSAFGQSGGSVFGQTAPTSSSGSAFGGSSDIFGGLGGKPNPENVNKNVFGGSATFGQSEGTGNLFGSAAGSSAFGQSFGDQKPSGSFSSTAPTSPQAAGTGGPFSSSTPAAPAFGGSGGFGGSPAFGSAPAFGASPAFGSPSGFGAQPLFQSPTAGAPATTKVFGSSSPQSGSFASFASQGSPTFGSISNQSGAPTFGQVAQQSSPGFGGSPFGGGGGAFGSSGGGAPNAFGAPAAAAPKTASFTSYRS